MIKAFGKALILLVGMSIGLSLGKLVASVMPTWLVIVTAILGLGYVTYQYYIGDFNPFPGEAGSDTDENDESLATDYLIKRSNLLCNLSLHDWDHYESEGLGQYDVCQRCGEKRGIWKGEHLSGFDKKWWSSVGEEGDTVTVIYEDGTKEVLRTEDDN